MDHLVLCTIGPNDWVSEIGKQTTETIFSVRNLKKEERVASVAHPSKYPEKIRSLIFSLYLGENVILNVDRVDRNLGEILIALDLMDKKRGMIITRDEGVKYQLDSVIGDNPVSNYSELDGNPALVRESIFGMEKYPVEESGPLVVIDQAFSVKGVGCVALGFVRSGTITKHQDMFVQPNGSPTQIRSIQIQDQDREEAPSGSRVGLALKNVDPEILPRGSCLVPSPDDVEIKDRVRGQFRIPGIFDMGIEKGMKFHLQSSLQMVPCEVTDVGKAELSNGYLIREIELESETPVWFRQDHRLGLCYLDSKSFRYFASGKILL